MSLVLALNPGSNSLKFDLVEVDPNQLRASAGRKILSGTVDDIGKPTKLVLVKDGTTISEREGDFADFSAATERVVEALCTDRTAYWDDLTLGAVRVVHGGSIYRGAVSYTEQVRADIQRYSPLAPLHNANSLRILDVLREKSSNLPLAVTFDTAFHHTLPEYAWRYPIARDVADAHGIRRYGFHGLSHRYMLEQYAYLTGREPAQVSAVTLHLESGSSACAIQHGRSIDTSMGFTPLEGLMMGTRSGSVDPAILPFLMEAGGLGAEEALSLLEKKSGLLGISGVSLDTRILRTRDDEASKLALRMFAYRALHYVGAYMAILGEAEAIVFGGGIGENTLEIRTPICQGIRNFGLQLDSAKNEATLAGDAAIHRDGSPVAAWVIHVEEGMQMAFECASATL